VDFFSAQTRARQQSRLLAWAFAACVVAVVLALNTIVLTALRVGYATGKHAQPWGHSLTAWALAHPGVVTLVTLITGGFIGAASFTRHLQLREGGSYVARSVGGVRVDRSTPDPRRRQLYNVVEEMALASGVPVPEVYVLEKDDSINAFAAGHSTADAAVAVTRGTLLNLNRDQLQGVIAHEFSHILNGDMRLSIRLMSMVFGLMAVSLAGRLIIRLSVATGRGSRRDRGAVPLLFIGIAVTLIGLIGFWAGRILQAWISRKRECLADASAVQFTRNPEGLRDALVRIAAQGPHGRSSAAGLDEIEHMLLVSETPRLLATHPPLEERVHELDPQVTPARFESLVRQAREQMQRERLAEPPAATPSAVGAEAVLAGTAVAANAAALIAASAGEPKPWHLEHAIAIRRALPSALRASAEQPERAGALLLAIVIFTSRTHHDERIEFVRDKLGPAAAASVQEAAVVASQLAPMLRLPAVLQLMPALRALPLGERVHYVATLKELMRLDGGLSVFEYALEKLAIRALLPRDGSHNPHGNLTLDDAAASLGVLFSVLARQGAPDDETARHAYEAGLAPLLPRIRPAYSVISDWVPLFDRALEELCRLRVAAKQLLIEGLVRCIAQDEILAPAEAELLRAICAVLECPLPTLLPPASTASART
jgi:Zn-dependent protease with chaperone function